MQGPPTGSLWTRRFVSVLVAQASFGYSMSAFFLVPKYMRVVHSASAQEIGWVTAANSGATLVCLLFIGPLADRHGRRIFLTLGAAVMALASLAFPLAESVGPLMFLLRAAQGTAFAMAFVGGATLIVDAAPPQRLSQAIGLFGLSMLSMNAVAPALLEASAQRLGWPQAMWLASIGACVSFGLSFAIREDPVPQAQRAEAPGLRKIIARPREIRVGVIIALVGAVFGCVFTFHQPFALELGISEVRDFFIGYAAVAMAVRLGLGRSVDRIGPQRVALWTLLLYAGVALGMANLQPGGLGALGALFGLAHGLFYPAFNATAVAGAPENERGTIMALFQSWFNVGFAAGGIGFGAIADSVGYPAGFYGCVGLTGLAFLLFASSPESRTRTSSP